MKGDSLHEMGCGVVDFYSNEEYWMQHNKSVEVLSYLIHYIVFLKIKNNNLKPKLVLYKSKYIFKEISLKNRNIPW